MATYEARRLENIKRNQALIDQLGIQRHSRAAPTAKPTQPASKKRKLSHLPAARPSRVSARIASAPAKPTYNEDAVSLSSSTATSRPRKKIKPDPAIPGPNDEVDDDTTTPSPAADFPSLSARWTSWEPTAPAPTRSDLDRTFHFPSHPLFTPNKSPLEMLSEGVFGGSYYRPLYSKTLRSSIADDWKLDLPEEWSSSLNVGRLVASEEYDPEMNKYGVKCGQSIEEWEASGWIAHEFDVRGWFQWYVRFFRGRRCEDDERQVGRWARCVGEKGRWRRTLLKKYLARGVRNIADEGGEEEEVSPVLHQTCLHWAWDIRQDDLDRAWQGD